MGGAVEKSVAAAAAASSYSLPPPPCTPKPNVRFLEKKSPDLSFQDQLRLAGIEVKQMKDEGGKGIGMICIMIMAGFFFFFNVLFLHSIDTSTK